jgi:hypothetical protein
MVQKNIKYEHARVVRIFRDFSGGCFGSLRSGIRLFTSQPWSGDPKYHNILKQILFLKIN